MKNILIGGKRKELKGVETTKREKRTLTIVLYRDPSEIG